MTSISTPLYFTPGFKLIDTTTKSVRINARGLFLTYSTPLDKQAFQEFLLSKPTCRQAQVWVVHESTINTHVLIDFGSYRFETRNKEFFDFAGVRPTICSIDGRHPSAWHRAILYLLHCEPTHQELLNQLELAKAGTPLPKKDIDTLQVIMLLEQLSAMGIKVTV